MNRVIKEFREFAVKGNMVDLAIGIVIGTSFGKITSSLVNDIITPVMGYFVGRVDFSKLSWVIQRQRLSEDGLIIADQIAIRYGLFIQVFLDFIIIALVLFGVVKFINSLKKKAEDPKNPAAPTPKDILLLSEIRDLLKSQAKQEKS